MGDFNGFRIKTIALENKIQEQKIKAVKCECDHNEHRIDAIYCTQCGNKLINY